MATKKYIIILYIFAAPFILNATEQLTDTGASRYYFEMQEDGNPLFTQRIVWNEISDAYGYELIIRTEEEEIYRLRTKTPGQDVHLRAGIYEYSIVVYNLLNKIEQQSPWIPLEIIKAELPQVFEITPEKLYIEEANTRLILKGEHLYTNSEYWLMNSKSRKIITRLEDVGLIEEDVIQIQLPDIIFNPGDYSITVINPGGLNSESPSDFHIKYLKPFDISFSLGYAPYIPIYDSWFTSNWDDPFYPLGSIARADLYFLKRSYGYFGVELQANVFHLEGGVKEAVILSNYFGGGINLLYKYLFSEKNHGIFRLGGGYLFNTHTFDYEGYEGASLDSLNPYMTSGLSYQYYIIRFLYVDLSLDWNHIFNKSHSFGSIQPSISLGWSY